MLSVWKSIQKIEINSKLLLTQSKKRRGNTSFQRTINGILKSIHEIINIILGRNRKQCIGQGKAQSKLMIFYKNYQDIIQKHF